MFGDSGWARRVYGRRIKKNAVLIGFQNATAKIEIVILNNEFNDLVEMIRASKVGTEEME